MNRIPFFLLTFFIISNGCSSSDNQVKETLKAEIVIESIPTRMPGPIFLKDSLLIMLDPFSQEGFIRLFNISNGIEIAKAGKLGRGPEEFITPGGSQIYNNQFVVFDPNLNGVGYFSIDSIITGSKKPLVQFDKRDSYQHLTSYIKINEDLAIGADYAKTPLKLIQKTKSAMEGFGKYPIHEEISNTFDVFQGSIKYNPMRNLLVYAFFSTRHITLYKKNKDGLNLQWEKQFVKPEYNISDKMVKWNHNQLHGFSDISFTKDYIVALINENLKEGVGGRDRQSIPRTLYILDYNGNLLNKYNVDVPILRICTNISSNTIYAIGLKSDFCLVKFNIDKEKGIN